MVGHKESRNEGEVGKWKQHQWTVFEVFNSQDEEENGGKKLKVSG